MTADQPQVTHCWVYRSSRKQEMYLYLADEDGYEQLPEALKLRFGKPTLVIQLELQPDHKLARDNIDQVLADLHNQGYHLQLPPDIQPKLYHGD